MAAPGLKFKARLEAVADSLDRVEAKATVLEVKCRSAFS